MMRATTTAVLVDDEPTLLDYLQKKLAQAWPELDVVATAANGVQAVALCRDLQPDVVFLDIQMPGLDGMQVARCLPAESQVVFVTAHDEYAVDAFENAAADYLLKPVTLERLTRTAARLKARELGERPDVTRLLDALSSAPAGSSLRWLRTGLGDTTELVPVDEVVYFKSDSKYTRVVCANRELLLRMSIRALAEGLNDNEFWQVHRGIIVRVDQVARAERDLRGRYVLTLRSRPEKLRTSVTHGRLFKQM